MNCRQLLALGVIKAVGIIGCSFCINNFSAVLVISASFLYY